MPQFVAVERKSWVLFSLLELSEKQRFDWFSNTAFETLLLPLLDKGEVEAAHLDFLVTDMQATWERDAADAELGDHGTHVMSLALSC